jgi:hypothetical protein
MQKAPKEAAVEKAGRGGVHGDGAGSRGLVDVCRIDKATCTFKGKKRLFRYVR